MHVLMMYNDTWTLCTCTYMYIVCTCKCMIIIHVHVGMGRIGLIIDHLYRLMKDIMNGVHHAIMGHIDIAGTILISTVLCFLILLILLACC